MNKFPVGTKVSYTSHSGCADPASLKTGMKGVVVRNSTEANDLILVKFDNWKDGHHEGEACWWVFPYELKQVRTRRQPALQALAEVADYAVKTIPIPVPPKTIFVQWVPEEEFGYGKAMRVTKSDHPRFIPGPRFDFGFFHVATEEGYTIVSSPMSAQEKANG